MKLIQVEKGRTQKRILRYALVLIAGIFFVACTAERDFPQQPDPNDGEGAWALLTVRTPEASLPTRAQTDAETVVSAVRILVFEYVAADNEYKFSYQVSGIEITPAENQQTRFKALLRSSGNSLKLLIAANAEAAFGSYDPVAGTPEDAVRKQVKLPFSAAVLPGDLPMYGEILLPDGLSAGSNLLSAVMLRAIARVDVVKDLEAGSLDFILEEVYVFRNYNKIQLIPDTLTVSSTPKVGVPSIPDDAVFLSAPVSQIVPRGAEAIIQTYIPESAAATTESEKLNGTATVVVGGRFGGSRTITYYRADFDSKVSGHPFGQVLRNYRYVFNIKKVTAAGWNTPEDAANNRATSIVVDVQAWEDFSADLYFSTDQFAVSSRDISLRYVGNREKRLDVESTLPYQIQWLDVGGNPTGNATSAINTTISNSNFDVTIIKDPTDPEKVTHLLFRTRNSNYAGEVIEDKLRITVDNWSIEIRVKQDNTAMYSTRHFSVMSGNEVGHLGITVNPDDANARAMRKIIDKQFAPNGVIRIGGFVFGRVANSRDFLGATSDINLENMRRIIRIQNVIYLTNHNNVSKEVAEILLTWLDENPRRVLILGVDSDGSSKNVRNRLINDGEWLFDIPSVSVNYIRATASAETDDFFSGPFGEIASSTSFNRADKYAGYNLSYPEAVTPMIMSDINRDAMIFGINKQRRIIYHGDANLFRIGQLSNNDGNAVTDQDKFMANVWAWITEQLIYGND